MFIEISIVNYLLSDLVIKFMLDLNVLRKVLWGGLLLRLLEYNGCLVILID